MKCILIALLAFSLLFFGCTGGEQQQPPQNQQPSTTSGTPAKTQPSGTGQQQTQAQPKDEGALGSFTNLLKGNAAWKADYTVTTSGYGGGNPVSQISYYFKLPGKMRTDITSEGMESRTYVISSDVFVCSKQGEWSCLKFPGQKESSYLDIKDAMNTSPSDFDVVADGTMQVAGTTATCFKITEAARSATSRYCLASDGALLYLRTASMGKDAEQVLEMKATSYSTSVPDSDFSLPATPTELNMPAGGGSGSSDPCSICNYLTGSEKADCLSSCSPS